jgi:integrase
MLAGGEVGFQNDASGIFGKMQESNGKLAENKVSNLLQPPKQSKLKCLECSSQRLYRDGLYYPPDGEAVQRWLCRDCGYRFSEKPLQKNHKWSINNPSKLPSSCQICALEAKNLDSTAETKTVAGDKKKPLKLDLLPEVAHGHIVQFRAYLERNGFCEENTYPAILTRLAAAGADLTDPENVKTVIARFKKKDGEPWSDSMKGIAVSAYDAFCRMQKITWERPKYFQNEIETIVPDEKDLDALISAASKRFGTYLLSLKETFADPSEVLAVEWTEFKDNVMYINHPVKRHYPGKYELSPQLVGLINALPREHKRIFPMRYRIAANTMRILRRRAAAKFNNQALLQISLKSFRHWGGSMLAYMTNGNVPEIARVLRHKSWRSTKRYVHTLKLSDEDFDVTSATTSEEILSLGKAGWQKYDEGLFNGVTYHYYRKPKRFGVLRKK